MSPYEAAIASALDDILLEPFRKRALSSRHPIAEATGSERQPAQIDREFRLVHELTKDWMHAGSVRGFGIAEKHAGGQRTGLIAVRVYVEKKRPKAALEIVVPEFLSLPGVGQVPTDIVEIGRVHAQSGCARHRPAMPGVSIGHQMCTAGTLGCLVRRKDPDGKIYVLSNAHVLAPMEMARRGDPILQPGRCDGGTAPEDRIAALSEYTQIDFGGVNEIDAAIAEVLDPADVIAAVREIDLVPRSPLVRRPRRGQKVTKVGRSSGSSTAEIVDADASITVDYQTPGGMRSARFHRQIVCTPFTTAGDSGSLVMTDEGRPVGLHFAGSENASIANRIATIFDNFRLAL